MVKLTVPVVPGLFHLTALPPLALASFTTAPQVPTFAFSASTLASWRASAGSEPTKSTAKLIQANSRTILLGIPIHLSLVGQRKGVPLCPSCSLNDCTTSESVSGRKSLRTAPPGRIAGVVFGVGNLRLTAPAHFDRVDLGVSIGLGVVSLVAHIGYLLAIGRVGRTAIVRVVVGYFGLAPTAYVDGVNLRVVSVGGRKGYPLAVRRVGRFIAPRNFGPTTPVGVNRVDTVFSSVVCISYLAVFARKGGLRLTRHGR